MRFDRWNTAFCDMDVQILSLSYRTHRVTAGTHEPRSVAFFDLSNGVKLAIWDQDDLAHDSGLTKAPASSTSFSNGVKLAIWDQDDLAHDSGLTKAPASSTSFSIGHNVSQRSEVDEVMEQAREAGAAIVKPAQETFYGGYAGYFTDPDGHLWEIVWNPGNLAERTDLSPLP
ncbi:hypothetical protein CN155_29660 [Sinorhizobium meliloti]|uniref:VOC family protein n=1 Tax=Rhizobium meliloti TaxID=382 RepID=UPI000D1FA792|nr:VOC family protein [Sinorhizobium meliloti]RMI06289.1 hypothetical protein DA101_028490 [Sinorhizobium meliloti]RVK47930.1 hypothetical protein CN155_29660 [Sinorhizobium meliloti]